MSIERIKSERERLNMEKTMECFLNGKKVLVVATAFFGYDIAMKKEIERLGAEVRFYDERSVKSSIGRALIKISPTIFYKKTKKHHLSIINANRDCEFDIVYIYGGSMLNEKFLKLYKSQFTKAKFVLYLADSVRGTERYEKMFPLFDKVVTFDRMDYRYYSKKYTNIFFLPLFYSKEYENREEKNFHKLKYDIAFVGTVHSDRLVLLKQIKKQAESMGLKVYFYCYLQAWFMYFYYYLTKKEFRSTRYRDFQYKKVSAGDIQKIMKKSKAIFDVQYPKNTGLTMRTLETLGMRRKLITTNKDIKTYDFYNENNICVIDRNNPKLNANFFKTDYMDLPQDMYQSYSITNWILKLLA